MLRWQSLSTKRYLFWAYYLLSYRPILCKNDAPWPKYHSSRPIDYQAEQVKALQTTETGSVGYQLTAAQVTHYKMPIPPGRDVQAADCYSSKNRREVTLVADQAQLDENKQIAKLIGNVTLTSVPLLTQNTSMSNLPLKW